MSSGPSEQFIKREREERRKHERNFPRDHSRDAYEEAYGSQRPDLDSIRDDGEFWDD